ncbi:MAG: hypothetical protein AAB542_04405 [Patescibacteria group bacterium]
MSLLRVETLGRYIPTLLRLPFAKSFIEDAILDPDDLLLEPCTIYRADKVAKRVRIKGTYPSGAMWAEYSLSLPDTRRVNLQASKGALVINIPHTNQFLLDIQICWDRHRNILNSFQIWNPKMRQPVRYFQISDAVTNIPETFTYGNASRMFSAILKPIEQTMDHTRTHHFLFLQSQPSPYHRRARGNGRFIA